MVPEEFRSATFYTLLSDKGQRATRETEAAMLERRAAQGFVAQA
ncbi:hypothetical protein ACI77J_09835 [Pseudomonas sp. O64]|nr:hypothetical protein [Pseudomonas sp. AU10]